MAEECQNSTEPYAEEEVTLLPRNKDSIYNDIKSESYINRMKKLEDRLTVGGVVENIRCIPRLGICPQDDNGSSSVSLVLAPMNKGVESMNRERTNIISNSMERRVISSIGDDMESQYSDDKSIYQDSFIPSDFDFDSAREDHMLINNNNRYSDTRDITKYKRRRNDPNTSTTDLIVDSNFREKDVGPLSETDLSDIDGESLDCEPNESERMVDMNSENEGNSNNITNENQDSKFSKQTKEEQKQQQGQQQGQSESSSIVQSKLIAQNEQRKPVEENNNNPSNSNSDQESDVTDKNKKEKEKISFKDSITKDNYNTREEVNVTPLNRKTEGKKKEEEIRRRRTNSKLSRELNESQVRISKDHKKCNYENREICSIGKEKEKEKRDLLTYDSNNSFVENENEDGSAGEELFTFRNSSNYKRRKTSMVSEKKSKEMGKDNRIKKESTQSLISLSSPVSQDLEDISDYEFKLTNYNIIERKVSKLTADLEFLVKVRDRLQSRMKDMEENDNKCCESIRSSLIEMAKNCLSNKKKQLEAEEERLGDYTPTNKLNPDGEYYWKGGSDQELIEKETCRISKLRESHEADKLRLQKLRRVIAKTRKNRPNDHDASNTRMDMEDLEEMDYDMRELKETVQMTEMILKNDESSLLTMEECLRAKRALYLKELRTFKAGNSSHFGKFQCLGLRTKDGAKSPRGSKSFSSGIGPSGGRYQLMSMIGKGGFSEVFKAYDLETHKYVAVKIHRINSNLSEEAKANQVKHVMREFRIHSTLRHPRIVGLLDYFVINSSSFGTVLDYSPGVDMDTYMKANGPLVEKEARFIIIQVLSGLKYLNTGGRKVIHYDLKPANLLYEHGNVKITDFGLSKVVEGNVGTIDLTSQFCGTYWYLPPECFMKQPQISNKVDVWSVGVIFYELLFGRRPFGHGMTQDYLLRSGTMTGELEVSFDASSKCSEGAKSFICHLLTCDRTSRPDVFGTLADPYIGLLPRDQQ